MSNSEEGWAEPIMGIGLAALLKRTQKHKAQVEQLIEALPFRDECIDMYGATGAPMYAEDGTFDDDPAEGDTSDDDPGEPARENPMPNAPHVGPTHDGRILR